MFELFPILFRTELKWPRTEDWSHPWYVYNGTKATRRVKEGGETIEVEVPGYGKEDLSVEEAEEGLQISFKGEKTPLLVLVDKDRLNLDNLKATCSNGLLKIEIPEKEAGPKRTFQVD